MPPPSRSLLSREQKDLITDWVKQGALEKAPQAADCIM